MLNEIIKNPELYKTDIIKKAGPADGQEPKEKDRKKGKKKKGRQVDTELDIAM